MTAITLTFLFLIQAPSASLDELNSRLSVYWDLLIRQEKAEALDFVSRQSRNAFLKRREPRIKSWKLIELKPESDTAVLATVELERAISGVAGFHRARLIEKWVLEDSVWRVHVKGESSETLLSAYRADPGKQPKPAQGVLSVVPQTLRIHFLDRRRRGGVRLANGLEEEVGVVRVEYDEEKFDLAEMPQRVAPAEYGLFALRYRGDEIGKDRSSRMTIVVRVGDREQTFEVPVIYNYLSPAARALFGLTPEEAEKLTRDAKLTPVLKPGVPAKEGDRKPPR